MTQISAGSPTCAVLAPFGPRLGAWLIDGLCLFILSNVLWVVLLLLPELVEEVLNGLGLFLWVALFLRFANATPGKLALGLSVQPWSGPGRLSWWSILRRFLVQFGVPNLIAAPFLYLPMPGDAPLSTWVLVLLSVVLSLCWVLLDCLWSRFNKAQQALHDKAAGTVVVKGLR